VKARVYFDTSVFGGIYDDEFKAESELLFDMVKSGQIICVFSELTIAELANAPGKIKNHFMDLPSEFIEKVEISREAIQLADKYILENVVGRTSLDDCRHIATATVNKVDYLVRWNFKHIVNVFRIRGYNAISIKNGHIQLDIRSPKEIVNYGTED
jgi:phosphosulfolactate synthase (CoM biosynthesis protein A)